MSNRKSDRSTKKAPASKASRSSSSTTLPTDHLPATDQKNSSDSGKHAASSSRKGRK